MNKIKMWLLQLWTSIMNKYAENQIAKLTNDFQEVYYEYECYKKMYNVLLILWLVEQQPITKIISEGKNTLVLQCDVNGETFQFPVTEYSGILKTIMELEKVKSKATITDFEINAERFRRHMLGKILDNYDY